MLGYATLCYATLRYATTCYKTTPCYSKQRRNAETCNATLFFVLASTLYKKGLQYKIGVGTLVSSHRRVASTRGRARPGRTRRRRIEGFAKKITCLGLRTSGHRRRIFRTTYQKLNHLRVESKRRTSRHEKDRFDDFLRREDIRTSGPSAFAQQIL